MSPATASKTHAVFNNAPAAKRWTGKLADLFPTLLTEVRQAGPAGHAERSVDRDFRWRVLPGGAVVGLRSRHDPDMHGRLELRIARAAAPETEEQQGMWDREVATFLKHFGVNAVDGTEPAESDHNDWLVLPPNPNDKGKAAARFLQLRKGETSPGKAVCHPCRAAGVATPILWDPQAGLTGQRCNQHRFEEGRKYSEEIRQRLGRAK